MEGRSTRQTSTEANMNSNSAVGIGVLAAVLIACGGQARDIGSNAADTTTAGGSSGSASSSPTPTPLPEWPSCESDGGAPAETWTGYVQSPTDLPNRGEFTLTLQRSGSQACGSIIFGQPVLRPPATDARTAAPLPVGASTQLPLLPGFSYSLLDVTIASNRLQFRTASGEPYQSWCALQASYPNDVEQTGYGCLPNSGLQSGAGVCLLTGPGPQPAISCDQGALCVLMSSVCQCNSAGCMGGFNGPGIVGDFHLAGDMAQGEIDHQTSYIQLTTTAP
jgi:hypothetical protein